MNNIIGVDILTSQDIMIPVLKYAKIYISFCVLAFSLSVTLTTIFLTDSKSKKPKTIVLLFVSNILLFGTLIFLINFSYKEKPSGIREYKATISEEANFVEIYDRYEIVSQEGKLYTIRDKVANGSDKQKGE